MRNPHGASAGLGGALHGGNGGGGGSALRRNDGALDGGNGGGGGSTLRRNDGARVPALGAVCSLWHWAQKG
jgi:hypothetical protein